MNRKQIPQGELAKIAALGCPLSANALALMFMLIQAWNDECEDVGWILDLFPDNENGSTLDALSNLVAMGLVSLSFKDNTIWLYQLELDGFGECKMKLSK